MSNVILTAQEGLTSLKRAREDARRKGDKGGGGDDTGGQPPRGDQLEKRVEKLETTMADVQVRLIRVESKLDLVATKADLAQLQGEMFKAMNEQTWKFIGAATGMSALFAAIAFGLARALS